MKRGTLRLVVGWAAFVLVLGCTTVPETGRRQLMLIGPAEEAQMGLSAFADIKNQQPISRDSAVNARVQRVGARIAPAVGRDLPNAEWEFVVFESEQVNAFALPGGKVGVYTGLLALAESDDELAAVMGHEIAHVSARHGAERTSQQLGAALLGVGVTVATDDAKYRDQIRLAYGLAATGTVLKYSRDHESEADRIGLLYMARAGYDPVAAVRFWRKMAAKEKGGARLPEWLSTHPSDETRIRRLESWLPEVRPVYEANRR
ncbi:MAG TPA: M48 family metallopeptidase [Opitutaceae bacterium]|nr:M48 family metallopeptidase [Opitutaceae bacterium]